MKFPPCTYNYSAFRDADIFFSHGSDFIGWAIRVGQRGLSGSILDLSQPNHAGFIYTIEGQVFAAEVGIHGIELHSIDEYTKPDNQIVGVLRPNCFDDSNMRQTWREEMARWIRKRQDSGYDYMGAVKSALPWWPWKNDPNKEFCSEDVQDWMQKYGISPTPKRHADPLDLYDAMTRYKQQFEAVLGYKIIPQPGVI